MSFISAPNAPSVFICFCFCFSHSICLRLATLQRPSHRFYEFNDSIYVTSCKSLLNLGFPSLRLRSEMWFSLAQDHSGASTCSSCEWHRSYFLGIFVKFQLALLGVYTDFLRIVPFLTQKGDKTQDTVQSYCSLQKTLFIYLYDIHSSPPPFSFQITTI